MKYQYVAQIYRVFANTKHEFGNPVAIVTDEEGKISKLERQKITQIIGFSETIFIDNLISGDVSIYNPQTQVKFAGHALVGVSNFINSTLKEKPKVLNCGGEYIQTFTKNSKTWINADISQAPPWKLRKYNTPQQVDNITKSHSTSMLHTVAWSWIDQSQGIIRARTFAHDWGIPEDEANGSGAMKLAFQEKQCLTIHHGKGSLIYAKPLNRGAIEVGGIVIKDKHISVNI